MTLVKKTKKQNRPDSALFHMLMYLQLCYLPATTDEKNSGGSEKSTRKRSFRKYAVGNVAAGEIFAQLNFHWMELPNILF